MSLAKMRANSVRASIFFGHFENYLFNGLEYNAEQYIVSGTFGGQGILIWCQFYNLTIF